MNLVRDYFFHAVALVVAAGIILAGYWLSGLGMHTLPAFSLHDRSAAQPPAATAPAGSATVPLPAMPIASCAAKAVAGTVLLLHCDAAHPQVVNLASIRTLPTSAQGLGEAARQLLQDVVGQDGKTDGKVDCTMQIAGSVCFTHDGGEDLRVPLLAAGLAVLDPHATEPNLWAAETIARNARLGLWWDLAPEKGDALLWRAERDGMLASEEQAQAARVQAFTALFSTIMVGLIGFAFAKYLDQRKDARLQFEIDREHQETWNGLTEEIRNQWRTFRIQVDMLAPEFKDQFDECWKRFCDSVVAAEIERKAYSIRVRRGGPSSTIAAQSMRAIDWARTERITVQDLIERRCGPAKVSTLTEPDFVALLHEITRSTRRSDDH